MAERALDDLLSIMRDPRARMRDRVNAAVSASRVSPLSMSDESEPEAIAFLRWVVDFESGGERLSPAFRREAAAAASFWERRAKRAELKYEVADVAERRETWRKLANAGLRLSLWSAGRWPADQHILLAPSDAFDVPDIDPDLVQQALMLGGRNPPTSRRQRSIDERASPVWSGNEEERKALLKPLARLIQARLAEFG